MRSELRADCGSARTLVVLLLVLEVCLGCDVRNHLDSPLERAAHAPVVFVGRVRHRSRTLGLLYGVRLDVRRVLKGSLQGRTRLRLRYLVTASDSIHSLPGDPCAARTRLLAGHKRIFYVAPSGGHRNFTALAPPDHFDKELANAMANRFCRKCGRKPRVSGLEDTTEALDDRLVLRCKARGTPSPRIRWLKDGRRIQHTPRIRVKTKRRKHVTRSRLLIGRVSANDTAVYTCRATNRLGSAASNATVNITGQMFGSQQPHVGSDVGHCWLTQFCLNGGTCTHYKAINELVCHCAAGFEGRRCERKSIVGPFITDDDFLGRGLAPPRYQE